MINNCENDGPKHTQNGRTMKVTIKGSLEKEENGVTHESHMKW